MRDDRESITERRLRALLDASPDAACLLDPEGTVLALNTKIARQLDTTPDRLLGANIFQFVSREIAEGRRRALAEVVRSGVPAVYEDRIRGVDWSLRMVPVVAPGAAVDSIAVFAHDLTQERRAAHDLRLQAAALTTAANGIVITDAEGRIEFVNPAFTRMTGYAPEEALGHTPRLLKSGVHGVALYADLWQTIKAGRVWRGEMTNRRKDGTLYPEEQIITPLRAADGTIAHFIAIKQDVSERREAAEALERRDAYFRALIEETQELIAVVDGDGTFRYASPSFERVLGYRAQELVGRSAFELVHPDDVETVMRIFAENAQIPGQTASTQYRYRHRDGTWRVVDSVGRNLRHDPVVGGVIINSRDVTDRIRAGETQRLLQERLAQSEKLTAMGELLAGVAHELNNPLSVVLGRAALLQGRTSVEAAQADALKLADAATRCGRIVRNFLALARQHEPERTQTRLNQVVRDGIELVAYPLRLDSVEVALQLDAELPVIWADTHQLQQVVVNLATNAHHAMREINGPRRLTLTTRAEPGDRVSLEIADTGPGIPPDVARRIFEPFFTTKPVGLGTGLGLSICKGIVERHGGTVALDPGPGRGARFRIELPIGVPQIGTSTEASTPVRGLRVLIVDDEPNVAEVAAEMLIYDGHVADVVTSGQQALERLARSQYDIVLTDVKMPDLDGPGLYRTIRQLHPELASRVAFFTGDTLSPTTSAFLADSGAVCVRKPFSINSLRAAVNRIASSS